jgi:hypothetical protein
VHSADQRHHLETVWCGVVRGTAVTVDNYVVVLRRPRHGMQLCRVNAECLRADEGFDVDEAL